MSDNTTYVILSEIRDLLRQSVDLQKQTLAEVRRQVEMEQSIMSNSELFATHISPDLFAELYGEHIESVRPQDNDNTEDEDN